MPRPKPLRLLLPPLALAALATPLAPSAPTETEPELRLVAAVDRGYDRLGLRRSDRWYLRDALDGGPSRTYVEESSGWQPVAGDWDGDGTATVSLFRDGVWIIRNRERGPRQVFRFGLRGDKPVVGDWDGDGVDTFGVLRGGRWYLRDAPGGGPNRSFGFGIPGDVPVAGDWDGDGDDDIAVVRGRQWFQRDEANGGPASRSFLFGLSGDIPVAGDWDHDLKDTPGVFRKGYWYLRRGDGRYVHARFGLSGDHPVVRREPGLAPGVSHRVVRYNGAVAHVVEVDMAAASTPDVVLAGNRLRGLETTSSMARRQGAPVGINGDFALSNGRPVHAIAVDGRLQQVDQGGGKGLGIGLSGTPATVGQHVTPMHLRPQTAAGDHPLFALNGGQPHGDDLVAFTAAASGLESPKDEACYAGITAAEPRLLGDGRVAETVRVTGTRCGGRAAMVPHTGAMLTGNRFAGGEQFIRSIRRDDTLQLLTTLGFPGAVDLLGGNPLLVVDGQVNSADVNGSGGYFGPNPRTAVATTNDGRLLLVVVDGRQSGYSNGLSLRDTAELLRSLGADDALNLDGGGSSTLFLNGQVANRPSDVRERPVSSALVVLPGADGGERGISTSPLAPAPAVPASAVWKQISRDPGSTGGLIDATVEHDPLLRKSLRRTAAR